MILGPCEVLELRISEGALSEGSRHLPKKVALNYIPRASFSWGEMLLLDPEGPGTQT